MGFVGIFSKNKIFLFCCFFISFIPKYNNYNNYYIACIHTHTDYTPKHTCNRTILTTSAYSNAMPILFNKCHSAFRKKKKLNKLLTKSACIVIFVKEEIN